MSKESHAEAGNLTKFTLLNIPNPLYRPFYCETVMESTRYDMWHIDQLWIIKY